MMYALRETLYLRSAFSYYSASDINWFLGEIESNVEATL